MSQQSQPTTSKATDFGLDALWDRGAKIRPISRAGVWLQLTRRALQSMSRSLFVSLVCLGTISITLTIFAFFLYSLQNIDTVLGGVKGEMQLTIFLDDRASPETSAALRKELAARPEVQAISFIDKSEALKQFRQALGEDAAVLDGLEKENPLPASFEVQLKEQDDATEAYRTLARTYENHPAVEKITYRNQLLIQLAQGISLIRSAGGYALILMLLITGAIVAATISLALYSRREEIYIMRLVGAEPWFVTTPCVIEGGLLGLLGGVLALLILLGIHSGLNDFLSSSDLLGRLIPELQFIGWGWSSLVVLCGVVVGVLGSLFAARRFSDVE